MRNWTSAGTPMRKIDGIYEPLMAGGTMKVHMSEKTWHSLRAAAMSGTMMRFTLGTVAGALVGGWLSYRWETRR